MESARIKHLEMIQAVITRMAQNSFTYKGWAITLVAGIFALAAARGVGYQFLLVALLPTLAFWGLDGYYLRQERLFRTLYDAMRTVDQADWEAVRFTMDTSPYAGQVDTWVSVCRSRTVAGLYVPITAVVIATTILLRSSGT